MTYTVFVYAVFVLVAIPLFLYWWRSRAKAFKRLSLVCRSAQIKLEQIHVVENGHQWEQIVPTIREELESANVKVGGSISNLLTAILTILIWPDDACMISELA